MQALRPLLYKTCYSWITNQELTAYLFVDTSYPDVKVPKDFIQDNSIVLNISPKAIGEYVETSEGISFKARFNGQTESLIIPFGAMFALRCVENGLGINFEPEDYFAPDEYLKRTKPQDLKPKTTLKILK